MPKTCCRKFQTENVLFPAAQETEKFSKPKKGKKKFVNPAAQETALALITGMSETGVVVEMANPQDMKVFAVERHGLPEDFVYFPALVWNAIVATRICAESCDCLGSATVAGTGRDSVFQVCVLLS